MINGSSPTPSCRKKMEKLWLILNKAAHKRNSFYYAHAPPSRRFALSPVKYNVELREKKR
jgi:hypothetical protein